MFVTVCARFVNRFSVALHTNTELQNVKMRSAGGETDLKAVPIAKKKREKVLDNRESNEIGLGRFVYSILCNYLIYRLGRL